jgi:hypothetical protein
MRDGFQGGVWKIFFFENLFFLLNFESLTTARACSTQPISFLLMGDMMRQVWRSFGLQRQWEQALLLRMPLE